MSGSFLAGKPRPVGGELHIPRYPVACCGAFRFPKSKIQYSSSRATDSVRSRGYRWKKQACKILPNPPFTPGAHPVRERNHVWFFPCRAAPRSGAMRPRRVPESSPFDRGRIPPGCATMSGSFLAGPPREAEQGGQKGDRGGFSSTIQTSQGEQWIGVAGGSFLQASRYTRRRSTAKKAKVPTQMMAMATR